MSSRTLKVVACFSLTIALATAGVGGLRFWRLASFAHHKDVGMALIESLRDRRPADISSHTWDNAINWTRTAYGNVFFSVDSVTSDDVVHFTNDARVEFAGEVSIKSLDWVWGYLARTGFRGQQYVTRFEPEYRAVYGFDD